MNYLSTAGIIIFVTGIILSLLLLLNNYKKLENITWSLFSMVMSLWGIGSFLLFSTQDQNIALFWGRFINYLPCIMGVVFFHFVCAFRGIIKKKEKEIYLYYGISIIILTLALIFPDLNVPNVQILFKKFYYPMYGPIFQILTGLFLYLVTYGLFLLYKGINESDSQKSNQSKYLLAGFITTLPFGSMTFLPVYNILIVPLGIYLIPAYVLTTTIAIIKYRLMDIDLAWRYGTEKIISFILSVSFLFCLSFFLFMFLPNHLVIIILLIIAFILNPYLKDWIQKGIHALLMKKYKVIWDKLQNIAGNNKTYYEIKHIVTVLTKDVAAVLPVNNPVYYKLAETGHKFSPYPARTNNEKEQFLTIGNILAIDLEQNQEFIYKEYLSNPHEDSKLKEYLTSHKIDLAFPLFFNQKLVGILGYGSKKDGSIFHNEEIYLLAGIVKKAQEQISNVLYLKYMSNNYADEVLKKYQNTQQTQLSNAIKQLFSIRTLLELASKVTVLTNRYLQSEYTYLYLYDKKNLGYKKIAVDKIEGALDVDLEVLDNIKETNYLMKYLRHRKEVILCSEIHEWAQTTKTLELAEASFACEKLKASLIVPLIGYNLARLYCCGRP
ncbi:MAG: hypothetical protein GY817_04585 [bacterium]|nr:hypothetical protein [bacterium]